MGHTGWVPNSEGRSLAESASTWMQVVFGGLGVAIALVALVIAYFAWVQPHSPDSDDNKSDPMPSVAAGTARSVTGTPPPAASATVNGVPLGQLTPSIGAANVSLTGDDLVIHCATGQTSDRQRVVQYDLLGRYTSLAAELVVAKARDGDTPLQLKVFTDDTEAANQVVTKGKSIRLRFSLEGRQTMRIRLTCQFPDGEIRLKNPRIAHT